MAIYSPNMSSMISAAGNAAKVIIRDFYEIGKLQCSHNIEGVKKFSEKAYSKSHSVITDTLQEEQPDYGFSKEGETEYHWKITPIDGLYNFSRSIPYFAICISLFKNDEMGAIAIVLPIFREIFWAEKGMGAYVEDDHGTARLRLSNNKSSIDSAVVALSGINGEIFKALQGMQYRITGSTYTNMAYAAAGKIDAVIYKKKEIDDSLLVKEALGSAFFTDKYSIVGNTKTSSAFFEALNKNG